MGKTKKTNGRCGREVIDIVKKMLTFFEMERKYGQAWSLGKPMKRASRATGINESTIRTWLKKDKDDHDPVMDVVKSLHESVAPPKPQVQRQKLNDSDREVVRETISEMELESLTVTMPSLQKTLKEKGIEVSVSTVARTVKQLK